MRFTSKDTRVRSLHGPEFDCHLALPAATEPAPAVVLASAIHGVDMDLRSIAGAFASHGYIAAAPDLFWRTLPGPLPRGDPRAAARAQPRLQTIRAGEQDLRDVLRELHKLPSFNGRALVLGFCFGGPFAVLGPKRLGYEAGMACHGSQMLEYVAELEGMRRPVCIVWGDQDHLAPAGVRDAYRACESRVAALEVHVVAGVRHGFMMQSRGDAFDRAAYDFSIARALAMLGTLRGRQLKGAGFSAES